MLAVSLGCYKWYQSQSPDMVQGVTIRSVVVHRSKSSWTMTSLSGRECHNPTMVVSPSMSSRTMTSFSGGRMSQPTLVTS